MTSKYQISFALSCYILSKLSLLCIKIYSYEFYSYFSVFYYSYVSVWYSYVSRMYSYVSVCSVCYPYVTRMYSCGVVVMISLVTNGNLTLLFLIEE